MPNPNDGGTDFNAPPYNAPPGYGGRIAGPNELPDPGGYYEEPNFLGRMLGMQRTWHNTRPGGKDLYGDDAQAEASKWLDDVGEPGGDVAPNGGLRRVPGGGDDVDDEEDERGPGGPKMPGLNDLPNYTLWGQVLKRFGR